MEILITHSSTPELNRTTTPLQGSVVLQKLFDSSINANYKVFVILQILTSHSSSPELTRITKSFQDFIILQKSLFS